MQHKKLKQIFFLHRRSVHFVGCYLLFCVSMLTAFSVHANDAVLNIKPARCISLHEGQVCYQTLKIHWQVVDSESYCLHERNKNMPIMCWDKNTTGALTYEFASSKSLEYVLIRMRDAQIVAGAEISVAWVYAKSTRRESHWRVF